MEIKLFSNKLFYILLSISFYYDIQCQESVDIYNLPGLDKLLKYKWEITAENYKGAPLILENKIISSNGTSYFLDIKTEMKVNYPLDQGKGTIIAFNTKNRFLIKDIGTNEIIFEETRNSGFSKELSPKLILERIIIYQKELNKIQAVDIQKKHVIWEYASNDIIYNGFPDNNKIVCVFDNVGLKILSKETGNLIWKTDIGNIRATPYLKDSYVYALTEKNGLYCINTDEKKLVWHYTDFSSSIYQNILIENNILYFVSGFLYALDIITGNLIWKSEFVNYDYISIIENYIIGYYEESEHYVIAINKKNGRPEYYNTEMEILNKFMYYSKTIGKLVFSAPPFENIIYCFEIEYPSPTSMDSMYMPDTNKLPKNP